MTTSTDLTNRALAQIGTRSQITSMTDGSQEALYANLLYNELRDFMLRQGDYDFSIKSAAAGASAPQSFPWTYAYTYPADCIRVRELIPVGVDTLDPQPVEYNARPGGILTRVQIQTIVYTYAPAEDFWDAMFTESFVRLLASALAYSIGRVEASKEKLQEALSFAGIANLRSG